MRGRYNTTKSMTASEKVVLMMSELNDVVEKNRVLYKYGYISAKSYIKKIDDAYRTLYDALSNWFTNGEVEDI